MKLVGPTIFLRLLSVYISYFQCAKSLGINYDLIKNCMAGELGNNLEHNMAVKTGRLQPPHQYVPWVTLFGVRLH